MHWRSRSNKSLQLRFFSTSSSNASLDDEYAALLRSCARSKSLPQAKSLHHRLAAAGHIQTSLYLANLVIQMYGCCSSATDARHVFDHLTRRNKFSWNILLSAYAHNGDLVQCRETFQNMPSHDTIAWNTLLTLSAQNATLDLTLQIFRQMPTFNTATWNVMLQAYAAEGELSGTKRFFDSMPVRNSVSWTCMMAAFGEGGKISDLKDMFERLPEMNLASSTIMVQSLAQGGCLPEAKELFDGLPERDEFLWNMYISEFSKVVGVENAEKAFVVMPERSVVSWNCMIQAFALSGRLDQAMFCFRKMPERNRFTWNSMIQILSMNGEAEAAKGLFEATPQRDIVTWNTLLHALVQHDEGAENIKRVFERFPLWNQITLNVVMQSAHALNSAAAVFDSSVNHDNVVTWNLMISSCARAGDSDEAVHLFRLMDVEGVKPDSVTYISIFDACSRIAPTEDGGVFVSSLVDDDILRHSNVANAVLSMYGKAGLIDKAWEVFTRIPLRDSISWNAMLTAFTRTGHGGEALDLFHEMEVEGFCGCVITFVNILCACSHLGLVERARDYFCSMVGDYGLAPVYDHYVCMTDLLARAGRLRQAEELVNVMPFEPEYEAQMALLGACKSQGDVVSGNRAAKLFPQPLVHSPYLLLSHLHVLAASQ